MMMGVFGGIGVGKYYDDYWSLFRLLETNFLVPQQDPRSYKKEYLAPSG